MGFAQAIDRVNAAVVRHLSDASSAQLDGVGTPGLFDRRTEVVLDGVLTTMPTFAVQQLDAPNVQQGSTLVIGSEIFRVREVHLQGIGMLSLVLEDES